MDNWYIGQEIVCIRTHSDGIVVKGKTYTISSLKSGFCKCTGILIDIGCTSNTPLMECPSCGAYILDHSGTHWASERLFAPIEYNSEAISELLEQKTTA